MALPSGPSNGEIGYLNGITYQFDGVTNRWLIIKSNYSTYELEDFSNNAPSDNNVVLWDSDYNIWVPSDIQQALGATKQQIETFVAEQNQSTFTIRSMPIGAVAFHRNGILIESSSFSVSSKVITYSGETMQKGDIITVIYNRGTNVAFSAELNDLTDVDYDYTTLKQNDVLGWDSETESFKSYGIQEYIKSLENRIEELEGDLAQAVADRIFTDNLLSKRIDDNDSDTATKGQFFVQSTEPTGGPNCGWVNTNSMRLYVFDTNESVWVQTQLT